LLQSVRQTQKHSIEAKLESIYIHAQQHTQDLLAILNNDQLTKEKKCEDLKPLDGIVLQLVREQDEVNLLIEKETSESWKQIISCDRVTPENFSEFHYWIGLQLEAISATKLTKFLSYLLANIIQLSLINIRLDRCGEVQQLERQALYWVEEFKAKFNNGEGTFYKPPLIPGITKLWNGALSKMKSSIESAKSTLGMTKEDYVSSTLSNLQNEPLIKSINSWLMEVENTLQSSNQSRPLLVRIVKGFKGQLIEATFDEDEAHDPSPQALDAK